MRALEGTGRNFPRPFRKSAGDPRERARLAGRVPPRLCVRPRDGRELFDKEGIARALSERPEPRLPQPYGRAQRYRGDGYLFGVARHGRGGARQTAAEPFGVLRTGHPRHGHALAEVKRVLCGAGLNISTKR